MTKKLLVMTALLTACVLAISAKAGNVKLVSDTWDSICKVEVAWGMNAPQKGSSQSFSSVKKEWSITKADRICYRRPGDPRNCNSQLTAWTCCSHLISGTDKCSLN